MRVKHALLLGVMALACVCMSSVEASSWFNLNGRKEAEKKQSEKVDDAFASDAGGFEVDKWLESFVDGDGTFDMTSLIRSTIDSVVQVLEDPSTDISKSKMLEWLHTAADAADTPAERDEEVHAMFAELEQNLEAVDDDELQQAIDETSSFVLEKAKEFKEHLQQPDGLQTLITSGLKGLGFTDDNIAEMKALLSDPEALMQSMVESMEQMAVASAEAFQDLLSEEQREAWAEASQQLTSMHDRFKLAQLQYAELQTKLQADPEAFATAFKDMPDDLTLEDLYERVVKGPKIARVVELEDTSSTTSTATARRTEDALKRTVRRQRVLQRGA